MGQPLATCCNPHTNATNQTEIEPFTNKAFVLATPQLLPVSQIKNIQKDLEQTLQKALKFRNSTTTRSSDQADGLWSLELSDENNNSEVVYCRGCVQNNQLEGEVRVYFPKGEIFQGKIVDMQPVEGAFVFKHGCFYVGQILHFNAEGYGRYENSDSGYIYQGNWSKSLPHGKGKQIYQNGDTYQGQIMYGEKFGFGVYRFHDGRVYQGSFYYNQSDGRGKISYADNSSYEGEWKLGKFNGKGFFRWPNGQTYDGQYRDGLRHGQGKYIFKNGSWFQGSWENGVQSGHGVFHEGYDDIEGQWAEGQLLG